LIVIALGTSGCYFAHIAAGQSRLLRAGQPIESLLADPATSAELRSSLLLVQRVRTFANELGLEVGEKYTSFAPWPGDRIITTVVASNPGEVTPAGFLYPFFGRLPYKSFFDRERADAEVEALRSKGLDVCVVGVSAYSTLGWMDDPITEPMLRKGAGALVETLLHELVHATIYLKGHADFNESVASFIGQEGSVAFYRQENQHEKAKQRRLQIHDRRRIEGELLRFRDEVAALYDSEPAGASRDRERLALEEQARKRIAALALETGDPEQTADTLRLNDACLALSGTYSAHGHHFQELLAELGGDLKAFIARLEAAAGADDPLKALLEQ
jgi:predicted aminopeptidase